MARIRVRKKRKKRTLLLWGVLVLFLFVFGRNLVIGGIQRLKMESGQRQTVFSESLPIPKLPVLKSKHPSWLTDEYPKELVELYERNPETKSFVKDYFKEKDVSHTIDLSSEVTPGRYPYFYQWDKRWGYETYGDDMMALTGCGPTCLSMVLCKLRGDTEYDPLTVAQIADNNGYYVAGSGSSWSLMEEGATLYGLQSYSVPFSDNGIRGELLNGHPIICVVGPGIFTTTGHFIVICGIADNGEVIIRDPNNKERSNQTWQLSELMGQIQNLWSYSL